MSKTADTTEKQDEAVSKIADRTDKQDETEREDNESTGKEVPAARALDVGGSGTGYRAE